MNERIFELVRKSEVPITHLRAYRGHIDLEKFAQLIIQECVNAVNDTPLFYGDYRNQIEESMRNACAWSIKDKFGVNDEE